MPRLYVVLAIFKRNFTSYFASLLGYLFIVAFVISSSVVAFGEKFFANNLATLAELNQVFPYLLTFLIPAITMTVWADERKLGTEELLFTLPVSDLEVLLGKYFAVVAVYTVALAFSLTNVLYLATLGEPDLGQIFATYLGYWLAGSMLASVGMVASYLTNSATVAFVLGAAFNATLVFLNVIPNPLLLFANWSGKSLPSRGNGLFDQLTVGYHLQPFGTGRFSLTNFAYFVGLTIVMLYVNLVLIGQRHWRGGQRGSEMLLHYTARAVAMAVTVVALFSLIDRVSVVNTQLDLTSEKVYTVSKYTTKLLGELSDKRPVLIQAFVSRDVFPEYVPVKRTLLGLLDQYRRMGRGNITVRVIEVDPQSEEASEAKSLGIEERQVQSERDGRVNVTGTFLGAVINSGSNEVVVPFFDVALPVEYELTRSIRTVAREKRKTVGILETDAKAGGGFDMQSFRSQPEWRLVTELKKQYTVENVPANAPINESKYDVLIAIMPSSLGPNELPNLVDYVRKGKPTLILDDPLPAFNISLSPKQPKPKAGGNPMFGGGGGPEPKADGGQLTSLTELLGIQWKYDELAFDASFMALHPEFSDVVRPEMIDVARTSGNANPFSAKSEVSNGLQEILAFFSGTIRLREGSKYDFEPLLRTDRASGVVNWDNLIESSFFGAQLKPESDITYRKGAESQVLAAKISGTSEGNRANVIFVADTDIVSDWFFGVREKKLYNLELDNVTFVLNSVDDLAGDDSFIGLRKRRAKFRKLTRFDRVISQFEKEAGAQQQAAAEDAKKSLDDAKARFSEQVKKIETDSSIDDFTKLQQLSVARELEQRRIAVEEAKIEQKKKRQLDEISAKRNRQVRAIEGQYRLFATLLLPLPVILLGIVMFVLRWRNEDREIVASRRV